MKRLRSSLRTSVYAIPQPVSAATVAVMRQIDVLHLRHSFADSGMLRNLLQHRGVGIGRKHAARLMRRMRIMALYQHPRFIARLWKGVAYDDV